MTANFPDLPTTETVQAQGPSAQTVGNLYAAIEYIEVMPRLPMGPQGATGPTGPDGEPGAEWHFGEGDPNVNGTPSTGPNDIYVDNVTGEVWEWAPISQEWVKSDTLINGPTGPVGPPGPTGPTGPTGPQGVQGGGIKVLGTFPGDMWGTTPPTWTGQPGDGWIDQSGDLWGWVPEPPPGDWYNFGPVQGPTGPAGPGSSPTIFNMDFAQSVDSRWATQMITHTLPNPSPSVRLIIDYLKTGFGPYDANQMVGISYPGNTQVLLTADASIMSYNGWGKVMLQ